MKLLKNIALLAAFVVPVADAATWFVRMDRIDIYNAQKLGVQDIYTYTVTNRDASIGTNTTTPDNPQTANNAIYDDVTGRIAWIGTIKSTTVAGGHYINWADGALQVQGGNLTSGTWTCVETDANKACTDPDVQKRVDQADFTFVGGYARLDTPATNSLLKLATTDFANIENAIANSEDPTVAQNAEYYFQVTFKITGPAGISSANIPDTDGDGLLDNVDNCPSISNSNQLDTDNDTSGDACDTDDDNDTVLDAAPDNCPLVSNADQQDSDNDGLGDACEIGNDVDNDNIADDVDNCPTSPNNNQLDTDSDGSGNVCDSDDDGDSVADGSDNCPLASNADQADLNNDGTGDVCGDIDSDSIFDSVDNCPINVNADQADLDNDGIGNICDADGENDGVADIADNCPTISNADQTDLDNDAVGDACDADKDGDGVANTDDKFPSSSDAPVEAAVAIAKEKVTLKGCGNRLRSSESEASFVSDEYLLSLENGLVLSGAYSAVKSGSYALTLDADSQNALKASLQNWSYTICSSGIAVEQVNTGNFTLKVNKQGKGKLTGKADFNGIRLSNGKTVKGKYTFSSDVKLPQSLQ